MKKAQITVFVILGILILLVVFFVFFVFWGGEKKQQEISLRQEKERKVLVDPVNIFILDCLNSVSGKALELLGRQGFHISKSQGGISSEPLSAKNGFFISSQAFVYYLVRLDPVFNYPPVRYPDFTNDAGIAEGFPDPDFPYLKRNVYPWFLFPFVSKDRGSRSYIGNGLFGWNVIPPLEKNFSNSIQESLENYVSADIISCPQWSVLKEKGIAVFPGTPKTEVIFTPDSTKFLLKWPVRVETASGNGSVSEFVSSHPVRLKYIYNHIKSLIDKDVTDLWFNMSIQPNIMVNHFEDKGSVVSYTDSDSQLNFRPFIVRFARVNRAPVMEEINQISLAQFEFFANDPSNQKCPQEPGINYLNKNKLVIYNLSGNSSLNLVFDINITDPDEYAEITFTASPSLPARINAPATVLRIFTKDDGLLQDFQDVEIKGVPCPA